MTSHNYMKSFGSELTHAYTVKFSVRGQIRNRFFMLISLANSLHRFDFSLVTSRLIKQGKPSDVWLIETTFVYLS